MASEFVSGLVNTSESQLHSTGNAATVLSIAAKLARWCFEGNNRTLNKGIYVAISNGTNRSEGAMTPCWLSSAWHYYYSVQVCSPIQKVVDNLGNI